MIEERRQELKQLLEAATTKENLKIRYVHGQGMIYEYELSFPIDEYRDYLQERWASYSAEPLGFSSSVKPHIVNQSIKSALRDFIREELDPFIEGDNFHFDSYAIEGDNFHFDSYAIEGSDADGFRLEVLRGGVRVLDVCLDHLLKIAIVCGVDEAVSVFETYSCIEGSQGYFQSVAALEGIRLEADIQVCRGVRLITVPDTSSGPVPAWLLQHMPSVSFFLNRESEFSARGKTLLVIDRPVFSIFHKRSQDMFDDGSPIGDLPFQFNLEGEKFTNSEAVKSFEKLFCQALSLACNSAVQSSGGGWLFPEEKFFHPGNGGVSLGRSRGQFGDATFGKPTKVGVTEVDEAKYLYCILDGNADIREKLRIPIDRWRKSKTPRNPIDKIIDLGIAFEALYLSNISEPIELAFRLRLHAAWNLREDEEDRKDLMKEIQEIYAWRSSVVHTGKLPRKEVSRTKKRSFTPAEVNQFIERAQDLCQESIIKIIKAKKFPDWNSLILGGEEEQASS